MVDDAFNENIVSYVFVYKIYVCIYVYECVFMHSEYMEIVCHTCIYCFMSKVFRISVCVLLYTNTHTYKSINTNGKENDKLILDVYVYVCNYIIFCYV